MESLGKKIRQLRSEKGDTQEQLAHTLQISFQSVSKWETGVASPDISLLPIIAEYFGIYYLTYFREIKKGNELLILINEDEL